MGCVMVLPNNKRQKQRNVRTLSYAVTPVSLSVFTCLDTTRGKAAVTRSATGREKERDKDVSIRLKRDRGRGIGRDK